MHDDIILIINEVVNEQGADFQYDGEVGSAQHSNPRLTNASTGGSAVDVRLNRASP